MNATITEDAVVQKAIGAYARQAVRDGAAKDAYGWPAGLPIPGSSSYAASHEGRDYVVLTNINGVLAVYRVRNDGGVRELRRWPEEIESR